ncbi:MAG: hypothetical protein E3J56_05055 [Candidatus Aminicenantes bacterium]|nr:MAG: hypothetical protein E3J56_05055 [Candidatus Aminicenantes bacterium]
MRCEKVKEKLSAFIDNALDREKTSEIQQHLAECSVCNQAMKLLAQTWDALEVWEKIEPSDSFEAKFWQRVRERELRKPFFQKLLKRVIPAPATVIILVIGLFGGIYLGNIVFPKETKVSTNESLLSLGKENFLYLDNFEDFPPESVAGVYIVLTSQKNDFK